MSTPEEELMRMAMTKPMAPRCGIRWFECAECSHKWREATRDCFSPSGDGCPECGDWSTPLALEHHPEWPLDGLNLIADHKYLDDHLDPKTPMKPLS